MDMDTPGPGEYGAPIPLQPDTSFRFSTSKKAPTEVDLIIRRARDTPAAGDYDAWDRKKLASRKQKRGGQFAKSTREHTAAGANWPLLASKSAPYTGFSDEPGPGSFDAKTHSAGTAYSMPRRDSKSNEMERLRRRRLQVHPVPGSRQYDPRKPETKLSFQFGHSKKTFADVDLRIRNAMQMPGPADFAPVDKRSVAVQSKGATLRTSGRGYATQCEEYDRQVNPSTLALAIEVATHQSPGPQ